MRKNILDATAGSKMMWFDKENPDVLFCDSRKESHILCDGRALSIDPDVIIDFCKMPFTDNSFKLVVFDPPHLIRAGKNSWLAKKYGVLGRSWREDIASGFSECMRVLEVGGTLIFKWNESQVNLGDILALISPLQPLFGHTSGRQSKTIWMTFMKNDNGR